MTFINDGYKLVFSAQSFGSVTHGAHQYEAKQIEIHHPSEHTFGDDEVRSPLELQIICQDIFGNTAAISVLFKIGVLAVSGCFFTLSSLTLAFEVGVAFAFVFDAGVSFFF